MLLGGDPVERQRVTNDAGREDNGWNDALGLGGGGRIESKACVEGLAFAKSRSMLSMWPEAGGGGGGHGCW